MLKSVPEEKGEYWNQYYASREVMKLSAPSQFAAFAAQEAGDAHLIIEVGCGNGRDSLFFARHGFQVVAIDGSTAAIAAFFLIAEPVRRRDDPDEARADDDAGAHDWAPMGLDTVEDTTAPASTRTASWLTMGVCFALVAGMLAGLPPGSEGIAVFGSHRMPRA